MSKIIIGIDPDSDKHGVAIYDCKGKLLNLHSLALMDIFGYILDGKKQGYEFEAHIDDVCANNAAFQKKGVKNAKAATAINRSIGKCQQAQIELERLFEWLEVKVVKHKISKLWKSQESKAQFEKVTGWTGRSNEDTRSAAYFGWLGVTA